VSLVAADDRPLRFLFGEVRLGAIAEVLDGSALERRDGGAVLVVDVDGEPVVVAPRSTRDGTFLAASTIDTDGAWLTIRPRARQVRAESAREVASNLAAHDIVVESNDRALADAWLDAPVRDALPASLWTFPRHRWVVQIDGAHLAVAAGEVLMAPVAANPEHLAAMVDLGALLATRPHRLGRELAQLARALGGATTAARFELGGRFALTMERDRSRIAIDFVHRLPGQSLRQAGLRTRLRAAADTAVDPTLVTRRLRDAPNLARRAAASSIALERGEIVAVLDGLVTERDRLDAGLALVARLAAGGAPSAGPYR